MRNALFIYEVGFLSLDLGVFVLLDDLLLISGDDCDVFPDCPSFLKFDAEAPEDKEGTCSSVPNSIGAVTRIGEETVREAKSC